MGSPEALTKQTETARVYTRPDGSKRVEIAISPVCYEKDGQLRPIDKSITSVDGVVWSTVDTPYVLSWDVSTFSLDYASKKGGSIRIRLAQLDGVDVKAGKAVGTVNGQRIVAYAAPGLRIELGVYPRGVEIFKILENDKAPRSLTWEVTEPLLNAITVDLMGTTGRDNMLRLVNRKAEFNVLRPVEILHERTPDVVNGQSRTYTVTETLTGRTRFVALPSMARSWVDEIAYPVEIDVTVNEAVGATADDGYGMAYSYWRTNQVVSKRLATGGKHSGWRFTTVDVPNAATITSATLTVRVTARSGSGNGTISGEATDSATSWADFSSNSPKTMTPTTANTTYALPASTGIKTIDVTSIVQEIVNRAGWANNNDIRLGFTDVSAFTASGDYVYFEDYAAAGTDQAKLDIVYTTGAAGQPTMARFPGIPGMTPGGQKFGRGW